MKSYPNDLPVYSHNPNHNTSFPLLVLDVRRKVCNPRNEGFCMVHWHEELQFVYVKKGIVRFRLWEKEQELSEGCCMFINSHVLHYITEKEDCAYHSFLIPPRMLGFFDGSIMEKTVEKFSGDPLLAGRAFSSKSQEDQKVLMAVEHLDALYFAKDRPSHWEYRLSLALAKLWIETVDALETENKRAKADLSTKGTFFVNGVSRFSSIQKKDHERIRNFLNFVHGNYNQKISLEEIANAGSVSRAECLRCFKKYTGLSPYKYLQKYRLQAAAAFLETTDKSITDIAMQVQFPSSSAFISAFRKAYGMTPKKYRERKQELS